MKLRYRLFRKSSGIFFIEDRINRKQESLRTRDKTEAARILSARNEALQQSAVNLQIARAYLTASDPLMVQRTWQHVLENLITSKLGSTRERWERAAQDKALIRILKVRLIETQAEHFLSALKAGTVSTNVHLRKLHNFALDMNWLPCPVIPRRQWPVVVFGEKRGITFVEHQAIVGIEWNPERKAFYELLWHLGGSQSDVACLQAEDIDWQQRVISYHRKKTTALAFIHISPTLENILKTLPTKGPLFPQQCEMHEKHRAAEFRRRCKRLNIRGVTLHSYRYAWAERARTAGYPERFAMENLGHNSKAIHRAYAKNVQVRIPSLEEYEKAQANYK